MITIKDIPQNWKNVLTRVQREFPAARILGGSLRDLHHRKPVKDIDIFIPHDGLASDNNLQKALWFNVCKDMYKQPDATPPRDRMIHAVYSMNQLGVKYEFIFASPEACDISLFDINICQIGFDGAHIYTTKHFDRGVHDKTIRFVTQQSEKRRKLRTERIRAKYPEYKIEESTLSYKIFKVRKLCPVNY